MCNSIIFIRNTKLKKILLSIVVLLGLIGCNATQVKQSGNLDVNIALGKIESDGMALFNAMQSSDATDVPTSRESDLLEMAADKLLCEGAYQAVRVQDADTQIEHIYLILQPEKSTGILFGRHVRFDFKLGTNDLISITPSTKSCLLVPVEKSSVEAAFVTHLLSDVPTEFHVYLNLYHGRPIYVSTNSGLWKIENGKISKSK